MTYALGVDFGTTFSCMAWVDPKTGQPKVLENAEGETKTPSLVHFGEGGDVVGKHARELLEDDFEAAKVFIMPKSKLGSGFVHVLPCGRAVTPEEATAAILRKLKKNAEELHLDGPVTRGVLTCPATFGPTERDALVRAAKTAGFVHVQLLDEPVAAGLNYAESESGIGRVLMVYDLGGGTFDAAVLTREGESFRLALPPVGLAKSGGENFDRDIYGHVLKVLGDDAAMLQDGSYNHSLLTSCRMTKEMLSEYNRADVQRAVKGKLIKCSVTRNAFEELIAARVAKTVELTKRLVEQAKSKGHTVDTAVLIGGSSRIPLVQKLVAEALRLSPRKTAFSDFAVAYGAARCAARPWPNWMSIHDVWTEYKNIANSVIDFATKQQFHKVTAELIRSLDRPVIVISNFLAQEVPGGTKGFYDLPLSVTCARSVTPKSEEWCREHEHDHWHNATQQQQQQQQQQPAVGISIWWRQDAPNVLCQHKGTPTKDLIDKLTPTMRNIDSLLKGRDIHTLLDTGALAGPPRKIAPKPVPKPAPVRSTPEGPSFSETAGEIAKNIVRALVSIIFLPVFLASVALGAVGLANNDWPRFGAALGICFISSGALLSLSLWRRVVKNIGLLIVIIILWVIFIAGVLLGLAGLASATPPLVVVAIVVCFICGGILSELGAFPS